MTTINTAVIPAELRQNKRWVPWEAVWDEGRGKFDKIPHNPKAIGNGVSTKDVKRWGDFNTALQAYEGAKDMLAGIGYVMTGPHGIVGYDLDNCLDADGNPAPWALDVLCKLDTYTEITPSGKGLRMFCKGKTERDWNNHAIGIECYAGHTARFLTITTNQYPFTRDELREVGDEIHAELLSLYGKALTAQADFEAADIPDLLPENQLPALGDLKLSDPVLKFLQEGDDAGDRSRILFTAGCELVAADLDDQQILSLFAANPYAWDAALSHRRQDADRALAYLWKEHVLKARKRAVRMSADEFEVLPAPSGAGQLPTFARDKNGAIEAIVGNVHKAIAHEIFIGARISRDTFLDEIVISEMIPGDDPNSWRALRDADYTKLRLRLEQLDFKPVSKEMVRDVVELIAEHRQFDTAIHWLTTLPDWDGTPRIDSFMSQYFGAEDNPYTRSVARYMWTAMAGRVLVPGVKADMVPVLIGGQGVGKSTAIAALVPNHKYFEEIDIDERREDTNSRKMRGCLVAELPELKGLKTRDMDYVKSFLTRTHESWVPKFKELKQDFARRLIFIGTSNYEEFLDDETGNRRWLPVCVTKCDVRGIERMRNQLWAEAKVLFEQEGIAYQIAEELSRDVHRHHVLSERPCRYWAGYRVDRARTYLGAFPDSGATRAQAYAGRLRGC